ncbi:forespore capture DNA-binding protein RefZ [Oceanobacillus alkalisoli]|uniref:forespore capture DNA-binding protein RefZ n=1 Tax=Oceanobacillus alkalisoli TaxID=2925113 RepID=UPI001EF0DF34|nr:forespore capture DNA-binding protein RefZ [Oceanobacillus alkalisoli]MCF3943325.1 forespore capture DNA-binding protein RefZ [Oceanobacillus alkalisoli]MCG5103798.1 forespore capture DNA-binding protein RefZ [Oceanobacillus alkalisoli]
MKKNLSKQKVIHAASSLFFQKGFHGTSVRDIAQRAKVNVSSVSYYFNGKQGLLEYAVTKYYEEYLETIEAILKATENWSAIDRLNELIFTIIQYKQSKLQLTCFIQRELTLDSIFVREMTITYLAKENFHIRTAFFNVLAGKKLPGDERDYLLMQLKGMLITPYILHNEWKDRVIGDYSHEVFVKKYVATIQNWLKFIVENEDVSDKFQGK